MNIALAAQILYGYEDPARTGTPEQYDYPPARRTFEELHADQQRDRIAKLCRDNDSWLFESMSEGMSGKDVNAFLDAYFVEDHAEMGRIISRAMKSYCANECQNRMEQER